jgi:hypothetical protein
VDFISTYLFSPQSTRRFTQRSQRVFSVWLFFVFSVSTLRSLWLDSLVFYHKAHRDFHKVYGGFFGAVILCVLCVYFVSLWLNSMVFSPQRAQRFSQSSQRLFGAAILCVLCVYFALSVVKLDGFSPQSSQRVLTMTVLGVLRVYFVLSVVNLVRFHHKGHRDLHKVHQGFFDVLLLCALCVFFVFSVVPYFFHHKAHVGLHKVHRGFFGAAILRVLRVYFALSVVNLVGFSGAVILCPPWLTFIIHTSSKLT